MSVAPFHCLSKYKVHKNFKYHIKKQLKKAFFLLSDNDDSYQVKHKYGRKKIQISVI